MHSTYPSTPHDLTLNMTLDWGSTWGIYWVVLRQHQWNAENSRQEYVRNLHMVWVQQNQFFFIWHASQNTYWHAQQCVSKIFNSFVNNCAKPYIHYSFAVSRFVGARRLFYHWGIPCHAGKIDIVKPSELAGHNHCNPLRVVLSILELGYKPTTQSH